MQTGALYTCGTGTYNVECCTFCVSGKSVFVSCFIKSPAGPNHECVSLPIVASVCCKINEKQNILLCYLCNRSYGQTVDHPELMLSCGQQPATDMNTAHPIPTCSFAGRIVWIALLITCYTQSHLPLIVSNSEVYKAVFKAQL